MANVEDLARLQALLASELEARGVNPAGLARGLAHMGVEIDAAEISRRLSSGDVDKAFLLQCFEAAGAPTIHLDY